MFCKPITAAGLLAAALLLPTPAHAAIITVPDAALAINMASQGGTFLTSTPGTYSFGGTTASAVLFPAVILQASSGGDQTASGMRLDYSWAVTGGVAGDRVPIMIDAFMSVSAFAGDDHSDARARAYMDVRTILDAPGEIFVNCAVPGGGSCTSPLSTTARVTGVVGSNASVTLSVHTGVQNNGSASAYLDPRIYVDPNFVNASLYSIVVSDGIGNARPLITTPGESTPPTAAPEPTSLALFGAGLLGLGAVRRTRRKA